MKSYIRAIDGLRAIAVVAVVLFHAFPTSLRGGFIGVDVFFVISGFIITQTYFADLTEGRTTLRHFFLKRVRRLAPIYLVVLLLTTIASYAILTPIHLRHFAESLIAQPFYLQNIVFWHHGDYFEQALSKPLLHTWSLAVEEQFYLAYALLILVVRRARRVAIPLLVVAVVASLGLGYVLSTVSPKTAFYWLPTRVWQMAIGVVAGIFTTKLGGRSWRHALLPGIALMLWAILGFDEHARFPGLQSVAACAGTALALVAVTTSPSATAAGVLTNVVPVEIGKLSYSLYLWHWPIIALSATYLERGLRPVEGAVAVALTFVLSYLGYRYIEKPVRTGRSIASDRTLLGLAATGAVVTVAVALVFVRTDGATFRYPPEIAVLYRAQQARSPFRCPSVGRLVAPRSEICPINDVHAEANLLVLGDSHADVLDELLGELAAAEGMGAYLTKRDCKLYDFGASARPDCSAAVLEQIKREVATHNIKYVLSMAFTKKDFDEERALGANAERLLESVDRLFVMQVVPNDIAFDPAKRALVLQRAEPLPRRYTMRDYETENGATVAALHRLASLNPRVTVLDPTPLLCPHDGCDFATDGVPNYFDAHHLSPTGARRLAPMFTAALRDMPRKTVQSNPRAPVGHGDGGH